MRRLRSGSSPCWLLLSLLLAHAPVHAEIYKCTDAQGHTRYSDTPCGPAATVIVPEAAPPPPADAGVRRDRTERLLRAWDEENAQREQAEAEAQAARDEAASKCQQARNRVRYLTEAQALYRLDEAGNREVYSFAERAQAEEQARAEVARWCR